MRWSQRRWLDWRIIRWAFDPGELLYPTGDPLQRRLEIGQVYECQEQASDPERVDVCEQRQQAEDGDDFELQLLVAQPFGQGMKPEENSAQSENNRNQHDCRDDHQDVGLARSGQEPWQMTRGGDVLRWRQNTA